MHIFLSFGEVQFIFSFVACAFGAISKTPLPTIIIKIYPYIFFWEFYGLAHI